MLFKQADPRSNLSKPSFVFKVNNSLLLSPTSGHALIPHFQPSSSTAAVSTTGPAPAPHPIAHAWVQLAEPDIVSKVTVAVRGGKWKQLVDFDGQSQVELPLCYCQDCPALPAAAVMHDKFPALADRDSLVLLYRSPRGHQSGLACESSRRPHHLDTLVHELMERITSDI